MYRLYPHTIQNLYNYISILKIYIYKIISIPHLFIYIIIIIYIRILKYSFINLIISDINYSYAYVIYLSYQSTKYFFH